MKLLKAAFLDHSTELGGAEIALLVTAPKLSSLVKVTFLVPEGDVAEQCRRQRIPVHILNIKTRSFGTGTVRATGMRSKILALCSLFELGRSVYSALRNTRPDVLHCNTLRASVVGGLVGRLLGVKVIWHVRDSLSEPYLNRYVAFSVRILMRLTASKVIANSSYTASQLSHRSVSCVGSPIKEEFFNVNRDVSMCRNFLMIGRLTPWKGQLQCIRAFAAAFPSDENRLLFIGGALFGESAYEAVLRKEVLDLGISDRVEFVGQVSDVAVRLSEAFAVVHASMIPEPLGQVTIQAAAAGVPLIASNSGGPGLLFNDFDTARLHDASNPRSLRVAMRWVFDNAELAREMGERSRAVAEKFSTENIVPDFEAVLWSTVLGKQKGFGR